MVDGSKRYLSDPRVLSHLTEAEMEGEVGGINVRKGKRGCE